MPNYNIERNVVNLYNTNFAVANKRRATLPHYSRSKITFTLKWHWKGHSRSLQTGSLYIYDFLLVVDSNYDRQSTAFRDLRHQTTVVLDLEMNIVYSWDRYFKSFMRLDGYRSFCIIPQLRVVQGHWKCRHSLDHIPFSTGQPLLV